MGVPPRREAIGLTAGNVQCVASNTSGGIRETRWTLMFRPERLYMQSQRSKSGHFEPPPYGRHERLLVRTLRQVVDGSSWLPGARNHAPASNSSLTSTLAAPPKLRMSP